MIWKSLSLLAIGTLAACSPTIGPISLPIEAVVVLDRLERSLILYPVDSVGVADTILLGSGASPTLMVTRGAYAGIAFEGSDEIRVVNLETSHSFGICLNVTQTGACGNAGVAAINLAADGSGYAAIPAANAIVHFRLQNDGVATEKLSVNGGPYAFGEARNTVFAIARACAETDCQNWLVTLDANVDSIPISGPGTAGGAVQSQDGFLYVGVSGAGTAQGHLSVVNPLSRREEVVFNGFGSFPQFLASDGQERLFVASAFDGLMLFNTRTRRAERDAGRGVPLNVPIGITADAVGQVYVLEAGGCVAGQRGKIRVFNIGLSEFPSLPTGICPVSVGMTEVPASVFHFDD